MMSPRTLFTSSTRVTLPLLIAVALALLVVTVSLAAWATIDTDDGAIDSNWGPIAPFFTDDQNDASVDDRDEIKLGWYVYDGSYMAFRIQVWGNTVFSDTSNSSRLRAIAAIDCDDNGNFRDSGDRLVIVYPSERVDIYDGLGDSLLFSSSTTELADIDGADLEWRIPLERIPPECRGSIYPNPLNLNITRIASGPGTSNETISETSVVDATNPVDYGDAKNVVNYSQNQFICNNYDTRLPCNGARHALTGLYLGATADPDGGGLADDPALADDLDNTDDEEGVAPSPGVTWTAGGTGSLDVTVTGGNGYLNCWIDWNRDETFAADEQVVNDVAVNAGDTTLTVNVPGTVTFDGSYIARCRLSPNAGEGASPVGAVYGGEVEDHDWLIQPVAASAAANGADMEISWGHLAQNDSEQAYKSASPYFDLASGAAFGSACTADPCSAVDAGVVGGATADVVFYKVFGQSDVSGTTIYSTPSKETGLFEYALVAGTN